MSCHGVNHIMLKVRATLRSHKTLLALFTEGCQNLLALVAGRCMSMVHATQEVTTSPTLCGTEPGHSQGKGQAAGLQRLTERAATTSQKRCGAELGHNQGKGQVACLPHRTERTVLSHLHGAYPPETRTGVWRLLPCLVAGIPRNPRARGSFLRL